MAIYSGHIEAVISLTFSPDGTSLASGSWDTTIKLWDIQTGGVVKTFHGHTGAVCSVSISADCTTIASGSHDLTVCLWDIQTGKCHWTMQQPSTVKQIHFFPLNPKHLITTSDNKVQHWNIDGQEIVSTYNGSYITFSFDGTKLALLNQGVVQVQDSDSGAIVAKIWTSNVEAKSCCFSPDGRLVAIFTGSTVYIWNITTSDPVILDTFISHKEDIKFLGFSSPTCLISSANRSVRFWQVGTLPSPPGLPDSPIQSITLQTKNGRVISSDSDGIVRIWNLLTGLVDASFQTPARGSCRRDIQLIDNRWILVWHMAGKIHIWAIEKGELLQTADVVGGEVKELRISGDGSKIFYISSYSIKVLHIWKGEVMGEVELGNMLAVRPFLATDGSRVWVNTCGYFRGWDFGTPELFSIEPCASNPNRPHLDFVGGVRQFRTTLPPIQDTNTGKKLLELPGRLHDPIDAQWDGQYLVAGYDTGDVLILKCTCTHCH